ncbi:MAG: signal recognition particle-docking protein FtsY [Bacilli bacterium]|jgi:fused signal recognition particle receptor
MGLFSCLKEKFSNKAEKTSQYVVGLSKSRHQFADRLKSLAKRYQQVNATYFEELETILIEADVGIALTIRTIENLLNAAKEQKIAEPATINELLVDALFVNYATKGGDIENDLSFRKSGPTVLLMVGVNGVGKTTTIAKIAYRYQARGRKVLLAAGDTFRAGATEQLHVWATRLGCPIITGRANQDPASVAYEAAQLAKKEQIDLLIVDTAGRLQTKLNLMAELGKISRVLAKEILGAPHETFLVIDATTGQNGVIQAKAFKEATPVSGIVITKMDGTSKGGIILAIRDELELPVRFIGLGEKMDDLQEFDLDKYLYGLCLGEER